MGKRKKGKKLKRTSLKRVRKMVRELLTPDQIERAVTKADEAISRAIQDAPKHPLGGIVPLQPPSGMVFLGMSDPLYYFADKHHLYVGTWDAADPDWPEVIGE